MSWRCVFGCIAMLEGLAGCTGLAAPNEFDDQTYKLLIDDAQFFRASSMLEQAGDLQLGPEQRKLYREYRDLAAKTFEIKALQEFSTKESEGRWFEAEEAYRVARTALPQSTVLQQSYQHFDQHRGSYVEGLNQSLRIHRAQFLPVEIALTEQIFAVYPEDYALQNRLNQLQFEAGELAAFLAPLAEQAFLQHRLEETRHYDAMILQLGNSSVSEGRIAHVERMLDQVERKRTISRQQADKKKRDNLWQDYDRALQRDDYSRAQQLLRKLDALGFRGPVAEGEMGRLNRLIERKTVALIDEGNKHYTRGQLDDALKHWREAQVLVPNDQELKGRIKRAETFQANYRSLSQ